VQAVIDRSGYAPNTFARGLAGGRTGLVGAIASWITPGFFTDVVTGINQIASQQRAHILFSVAHDDHDYAAVVRSFCGNRLVDGLVLIAPPETLFEEPLPINRIPMVLCAGQEYRKNYPWAEVHSVVTDNHGGMLEMMAFLAEKGHRSFLYLSGPDGSHDARIRAKGVRAFLRKQRGLKCEFLAIGQSIEQGRKGMADLLKKRGRKTLPDAIVCFNDGLALGVIEALQDAGVRSGRDVTVTGCDDDPADGVIGLTTLRQPMVELGSASAETLFQLLDKSRKGDPPELRRQLPMTLVPRKLRSFSGSRNRRTR
jgi:LacI family transcriptional regulator